jgi:hypothetical protein
VVRRFARLAPGAAFVRLLTFDHWIIGHDEFNASQVLAAFLQHLMQS